MSGQMSTRFEDRTPISRLEALSLFAAETNPLGLDVFGDTNTFLMYELGISGPSVHDLFSRHDPHLVKEAARIVGELNGQSQSIVTLIDQLSSAMVTIGEHNVKYLVQEASIVPQRLFDLLNSYNSGFVMDVARMGKAISEKLGTSYANKVVNTLLLLKPNNVNYLRTVERITVEDMVEYVQLDEGGAFSKGTKVARQYKERNPSLPNETLRGNSDALIKAVARYGLDLVRYLVFEEGINPKKIFDESFNRTIANRLTVFSTEGRVHDITVTLKPQQMAQLEKGFYLKINDPRYGNFIVNLSRQTS